MTITAPRIDTVPARVARWPRLPFALLAVYLVLIIAVVVVLFPIFWMVTTSLKPQTEMFARFPTMLPIDWTFENYAAVWTTTEFPTYFWNSFKVAGLSTLGCVAVSIYAAYAMARIRFPGRDLFGIALLVTQMLPHILFAIPLFNAIQKLGLFNTHLALIIAYMAYSLPFSIWMLRGFFEAVPAELEDSAAIDGASQIGALHRIVLPLATPGIAAVVMYIFIRTWNEFLFALVFLQTSDLYTLPLGIAAFQQQFGIPWDLMMAGAAITTMPVLIFFLLMQRFIVQGLLGGAVKG